MLALAGIVLVAGCGGGDDDEPSKEAGSLPEPQQPISDQIPVFERATSGADCEEAIQVVHRVWLLQPERPAAQQNCDAALERMRQIGEFEASASRELGTAALVDGEADGEEASVAFALDEDGAFKWIGGPTTSHQIDTEPPADIDFDRVATDFIEALRNEDCKAAAELVAAHTRLEPAGEPPLCRRFEETFTATPEGFGSRLKEDPDAEPVELGATQDLAFYGVATEPAGYRTLVLASFKKGPRVLDVVPAER